MLIRLLGKLTYLSRSDICFYVCRVSQLLVSSTASLTLIGFMMLFGAPAALHDDPLQLFAFISAPPSSVENQRSNKLSPDPHQKQNAKPLPTPYARLNGSYIFFKTSQSPNQNLSPSYVIAKAPRENKTY